MCTVIPLSLYFAIGFKTFSRDKLYTYVAPGEWFSSRCPENEYMGFNHFGLQL